MASAAAPPPIAGTPIDPPPTEVPAFAEKLDKTVVGGIAYRVLRRYTFAKVGLLANGTAYYLFLALFSVVAFAFGIASLLGADWMAKWLTDALNEALPGVIGDQGIDPETLAATGRTAGLIGLLILLYSGTGAISGASASMHLIYGAPPDPRSFLVSKARAILFLLGVAPLVALSFVSVALCESFFGAGWLGYPLSFGVDVLILWILLGTLGGISPHRRPRLIASLIGAVAVGLVKLLLNTIMAWALDKPQYGVFAAPIAVLLILQLLSLVLYVSACIAAGISDADVPLEQLEPTPEDAVVEEPDPDAPVE